MFELAKKSLFLMSPEKAHNFVIALGTQIQKNKYLKKYFSQSFSFKPSKSLNLFGLDFPNPMGLAAGFDKNGQIVPILQDCGFGFIEVGTVTPKAQEGNPQPRLFRDLQSHSILNRMGFNNYGVQALVKHLSEHRENFDIKVPIGINIGKNKATPDENALEDYVLLAEALKDHGDYFVVNVSSPNTPGLRDLQNEKFLMACADILKPILKKPLLVKLAADLENDALILLLRSLNNSQFDGIILCNTTIDKSAAPWANDLGAGGLSGRLLRIRSREMLLIAKKYFEKPIISVGGIDSSDEVRWRLENGASLVQVYSELIFSGPKFIEKTLREL